MLRKGFVERSSYLAPTEKRHRGREPSHLRNFPTEPEILCAMETFWRKTFFLNDGALQPKIVKKKIYKYMLRSIYIYVYCVEICFVVYLRHGMVHGVALLFFSEISFLGEV